MLAVIFLCQISHAQQASQLSHIYEYSLKELAELKVVTGSFQKQVATESPSNITIITKQMIDERGYQTLVDLCQDIPGFDFMVYNDGSSEHSTYNMNRGIGTIGNPNILIMIDGIIQNNISFNWSLLWTYENMFIDVERVEIVQGPGSVLYGAQAVTGVIHIITKKKFNGVDIRSSIGTNLTRINDIYIGTTFNHNLNASLAVHTYTTNGDNGIGRHDPGNYFQNQMHPLIQTEDYDRFGEYVTNRPSENGGQPIKHGFNTSNNSYAARLKVSNDNNELGVFWSEYDRGYGSTILSYKYDLTSPHNRSKFRSYHSYLKNTTPLSGKLKLNSDLVFRSTNVLSGTGLRYLYRFNDLTKGYSSKSYQAYLEEKLTIQLPKQSHLYIGLKGMVSLKSESIVSIGEYDISRNTTSSSWDEATDGQGLNQPKTYPRYWVQEVASYVLYDRVWLNGFTSSIGVRYDYSTEFEHILNPRLSLIYSPKNSALGAKLLYGRAYRQPSIFELTSEFRGNKGLTPEKIETTELEINGQFLEKKLSVKSTTYLSSLTDFIGKVADSTKIAGERFENLPRLRYAGITSQAGLQLYNNTILNLNYNFLTGLSEYGFEFEEIERSARHKINAGINQKLIDRRLTLDLRGNWVGKRKAQETNTWLQTYEGGYAPSYLKLNFTSSYQINKKLMAQIMINNLTDKQFYGVGRETGSGFVDEYDYRQGIDPDDDFIPSYHPQPGRTFLIRLIYNS